MSGTAGPANRLARESSPYLRLHAHNPVDWYPWGPEAIAAARAADKPIFLSVGYSTCYWCHVMERESFSDPGIAAEMNRAFVNVKVDREERPDLDEIYMLATQMLAGQGGWPNSVFLTPKLEPFYAGTYFPPRDAHGRPGFPTVVESMVHAWSERRGEVEEQAAEVAHAIRHHLEEIEPWPDALPGAELLDRGLDGLRQRFDPTWGGFGQQPKFPTPSNLWLLAERAGDPAARMMLTATLDAMGRGGIFDQLGGGFHRYSTDREWRVPHFEKMLYDNGLLLEAFAREHARSGRPEPARLALATSEWLGREMTSPEGALWSAIDAETGGEEGAYYVWSRDEIDAVLGVEDAEFLAPVFGYAGEPSFEGGRHVLHLPRPLEVLAAERRTTREALLAEIEPLRAKLLDRRATRPRPATDDKILADWNGTAIAGLAAAGAALGRPELVERAAAAASFVLESLRAGDGTLLHSWRAGEGRVKAFLSDYVFLVRGLLALEAATSDRRWLDEAERLAEEQERRLASPRGGYFNAADSDDLLFRAKEIFDGATPAANSVAALNALELAERRGEDRFLERAERTARAFAPLVSTHPDGARTMAIALARLAGGAARTAPHPGPAAAGGSGEGEGERAIEGVELALEPETEAAAEVRPFVLRISVRNGWHLASAEDSPRLVGAGVELEQVDWPAPKRFGEGEEASFGHEGSIEVRGRLRIVGMPGRLILGYTACGEGSCRPPSKIEIPVP